MHNTNFEPQDICKWDKDIEVNLIMHGSPCQDFSLAGKQAGGDEGSGTRSSLMYETIRIVEKLKPKYVIWENVKNVISKKHRHNFDNYLNKMEDLGYTNYYQVLNAKDYGIPQNRERVFTISILGNENFEFPPKQELKLKVSALIDALYFNNMGNTMMINLDSYKRIYYDEPKFILIDSKPEKTFEVLEMLRATLPDNSTRIMTNEEFMIEVRSMVESILTILYSIILLGIVLSLLGTSSNMLMGFEQSRRKYAIFYSSSMSKNKLKKLIVIEAALMIVISVASASAFSLYFLNSIGKALTMINMTVVFVSPVLYSVIFGVIASLLMMIVVIKPVRMLSKMDVVKEIKTDSD